MKLEVGGTSRTLLLGSAEEVSVIPTDDVGMGVDVAVDSRLVVADGV